MASALGSLLLKGSGVVGWVSGLLSTIAYCCYSCAVRSVSSYMRRVNLLKTASV